MSVYTEAEHAIALTDTLYWIDHPPITPVQRYLFGRYHYRLKDFNTAFHWFTLSLSDGVEQAWFDIGECLRLNLVDADILADFLSGYQGNSGYNNISDAKITELCYKNAWNYYSNENTENSYLPKGESLFRRGFLLRHGLGTPAIPSTAYQLFSDVVRLHASLTPDDFNICCDYSNAGTSDGGTHISSPVDLCKLPAGAALFEMAMYHSKNEQRRFLKQSYDFHFEEALFYDYEHCGKAYEDYEYQDDIRELFSFRIGQYTRVHDVNPSPKSLDRLACMYENGYPGDNEERRQAFAMKAAPLRKKITVMKAATEKLL